MANDLTEGSGSLLVRLLSESSQCTSRAHRQFLEHRRASLGHLRSLVELQIRSGQSGPDGARAALYSSAQLDAFGAGQISRCLGEAFRQYDGRRIPRIPNGDLKMMSRVVAVSGRARDFSQPASVTVEYDVPPDAWFLRDSAFPEIPYAVWMEIALQPCGFLSAYLDTYALVPGAEFYFRNLDGSACLREPGDPELLFRLRGETLTTQARLISSVDSGGTVIQRFGFEVSCQGRALFEGESVFGYFNVAAMQNQVGLDGGKNVQPWLVSRAGAASTAETLEAGAYRAAEPGQPAPLLARGRLAFLDQAQMVPAGGDFGRGYLYASRAVDPRDWYFPYHFSGDPVMPGSLGVEAILEGLKLLAAASGQASGFATPRFILPGSACTTWRYRGQITPSHTRLELDVHLRSAGRDGSGLTLGADANLWVDGLRIYEVKNVSVKIVEQKGTLWTQ